MTKTKNPKATAMSLIFGGLLPVLAFTLIEEYHGPVWGTVAGMIFGLGEIIYEKVRFKKVSTITWIGNAMILGLGGLSILPQFVAQSFDHHSARRCGFWGRFLCL